MDSPDYTTEHQKGKNLTCEDYVKIQGRLQDGWSANRTAVKELRCSPVVSRVMRKFAMVSGRNLLQGAA